MLTRRFIRFTTASALIASPLAFVMAQKPTPAAEQMLRELVRVVNAGDTAASRKFIEEHFVNSGPDAITAAERVERFARLHEFLGEMAVRDVSAPRAGEITAMVQLVRTESWRKVSAMLNGDTPPRFSRVGFQPAEAPDTPTKRLSDAEVVEQLKGYVERMAQKDVFSGTVLLAKSGKPLYRAAFGEANKDFGVKNAIDTKFNLGSMNKMFTSVSIMQLVEAGKISLDDTLGKFLKPGAMRPEVLSKVRVKHLLSHTSGLGSYFTPEWDGQSRARYRTVDDWMALVKPESLAFEPGTRWSYSNTGMLVLGKVIEVASGTDYFDYIRAHIYKPAGMINSDAFELDHVNHNLAVGYEPQQTAKGVEYQNNIFMHVIRGGPAGGGYSTVDDLTHFAEALKAGKLVSAASVRMLTTPKPELSSPGYGFGFGVEAGGRIVGHSGGFPGINSQLDIYIGDDYTVAVMSNYGQGAQPIIEKSRSLLLAGRQATSLQ